MRRGRRRLRRHALSVVVLACSSFAAQAQSDCTTKANIVEVASGVFVRPGNTAVVFEADNIANIGFVVGDRCVAVIDSGGSWAEGHALDCAIRSVTDRPVCYVVNTHVHPDHMLGNLAFEKPGVEFLGHHKLPRAMALRGEVYLERASEYADDEDSPVGIVMPGRTVTAEFEIDIGDRVLLLRAHRSAHTDHDLSVFDRKTGTIFLGDLLFLEHLPVIDGSINGWIGELDQLVLEAYHCVIPGHGPARARWPQAARPTAAYLGGLRREVRAWIKEGGDLTAAQASIGASQAGQWRLVDRYQRRNVAAAFAELEWEN